MTGLSVRLWLETPAARGLPSAGLVRRRRPPRAAAMRPAGLERISVHGTVWSTVGGTVPDAGVLTIRSAAGSVTVNIGRAMPHDGAAGELRYRVIDGTGAHRRDAGRAVLTFKLDPSAVHNRAEGGRRRGAAAAGGGTVG